jgi:hypothetical protein
MWSITRSLARAARSFRPLTPTVIAGDNARKDIAVTPAWSRATTGGAEVDGGPIRFSIGVTIALVVLILFVSPLFVSS